MPEQDEPPTKAEAGDRFNAHRTCALAILAASDGRLTIGEANTIATQELAAEERQRRRPQ